MGSRLIPKRLGLIVELVPKTKAIAVLVNPDSPQAGSQIVEMQEPTRALGLQLNVVKASNERELDKVYRELGELVPVFTFEDTNAPFYGTKKKVRTIACTGPTTALVVASASGHLDLYK